MELLEQNVKYNKIEPAGYELEGHLIWGKPDRFSTWENQHGLIAQTHAKKPVLHRGCAECRLSRDFALLV